MVVPQTEFLLSIVCFDDKEYGHCSCFIVDWPSCLIHLKTNQTNDSRNASIRSTFSPSSRYF